MIRRNLIILSIIAAVIVAALLGYNAYGQSSTTSNVPHYKVVGLNIGTEAGYESLLNRMYENGWVHDHSNGGLIVFRRK